MAPYLIRRQLLKTLNQVYLAMKSPDWDYYLEDKPKPVVTSAAKAFLAVTRARLRVGNANLADIRDRLKANESELKQGTDDLKTALNNLKKVEEVIKATTALLGVVARVVALAALV